MSRLPWPDSHQPPSDIPGAVQCPFLIIATIVYVLTDIREEFHIGRG